MSKYVHNRNFFHTPDTDNSYWAGFLAADGTVQPANQAIVLNLAQKDVLHVEAFKAATHFTGPVRYQSKTKSYIVQIYGAIEWIYDLENCFNYHT